MQPGAALQAVLLAVLLAGPRGVKSRLLSGECVRWGESSCRDSPHPSSPHRVGREAFPATLPGPAFGTSCFQRAVAPQLGSGPVPGAIQSPGMLEVHSPPRVTLMGLRTRLGGAVGEPAQRVPLQLSQLGRTRLYSS